MHLVQAEGRWIVRRRWISVSQCNFAVVSCFVGCRVIFTDCKIAHADSVLNEVTPKKVTLFVSCSSHQSFMSPINCWIKAQARLFSEKLCPWRWRVRAKMWQSFNLKPHCTHVVPLLSNKYISIIQDCNPSLQKEYKWLFSTVQIFLYLILTWVQDKLSLLKKPAH